MRFYAISLWATLLVAFPTLAEERPPIVAVMSLSVVGLKLPLATVDRLSEFLTARLESAGEWQVVPREQVKARLVDLKKKSYSADCDKSCQIELGQALSAQKTITPKVIRAGASCSVTISLYDLKRETSDGASTVDGGCNEAGIVASMKQAATDLAGKTGTSTTPPNTTAAPSTTAPQTSAAPTVVEPGPRVKKGVVTAAVGNLTVSAKTPSGIAVRLEVTDPDGKKTVTGSPFQDPAARVGVWKVVAQATGHETTELEVRVPPDDAVLEKVELKPLGALRIAAGEPVGAAVQVSGPAGFKDEGGLPWEAEGLRSGTYHIEVSRSGYVTDAREVEVEPGRTTWVLPVKLSKKGAEVHVLELTESGLVVDGRSDGTDSIAGLSAIFGAPSRTDGPRERRERAAVENPRVPAAPDSGNTIWTWDDLGLFAHTVAGSDTVHQFTIAVGAQNYAFYPKATFLGRTILDGLQLRADTSKKDLQGRGFMTTRVSGWWRKQLRNRILGVTIDPSSGKVVDASISTTIGK